MIRVGIIGTGNISPAHFEGYLAFPGQTQIVALCDIKPSKAQAAAERFGLSAAQIFDDAATMLAVSDLDLVSIATPPNTHAELSIAALEAGVNVLVEKPMAPSLEECDAMLAAAERSGKVLASVAQNRFRDDMSALKQVLDSGKLGPISHAQISSNWWRGHEYYDLWWRGKWETEGGGCLLNHAVHHVDLGLWLLGAPKSVTAVITNAQHDNAEVEDLAVAIWEYERGLAELTASVVHHGQEHAMILQGRDASVAQPWRVQADVGQPNGFPREEPNTELIQEIDALMGGLDPLPHSLHIGQIGDLLTALQDGATPAITGADGRASVEAITAMYKAAIERRTVDLPLAEDDPYYAAGHLTSVAPHFYEKTTSAEDLDGTAQIGMADKN